MKVHGRVWQPSVQPRRMETWILKLAMSITGLVMTAFVFVHMLGNLKIFSSHASFDAYSQWLREAFMPLLPYEGLLWIARVVLGTCLAIHVVAALMVWSRASQSRSGQAASVHGSAKPRLRARLAQIMLPTGVILLAFVVLHILDLTIGAVVAPKQFTPPDQTFHAAANLIASLDRPAMAALYLVALLALSIHLLHGVRLAVQDLGVTNHKAMQVAKIAGYLIAASVFIGDAFVVLSAHFGVV